LIPSLFWTVSREAYLVKREAYLVKREAYLVKRISLEMRIINMTEKIKNFRDLDVWKKGIEIVKDAYRTVNRLPKQETYGLAGQMKRCSISIPSNIAEGFNRFHNKEYKQFLYIALGSCAELETQIEVAAELKFIDEQRKSSLLEKLDHESRMLRNLVKKLD
jgi:four helix bundle protein